MRFAWLAAGSIIVFGCGDNRGAPDALTGPHDDAPAHADSPVPIDSPVPVDANPLEPDTLMGTGLCLDAACTMIASDAIEYSPRAGFTLYSDGASKRRWIRLPAGTKIDTTDMDHWDFPVGTQIWKEFSTGSNETPPNTRIETRYIVKVADDGSAQPWFYVSYEWNSTQDATTAQTMGVGSANGTTHDIPSRTECKQCHERYLPTRVLGFGAISLDGPPAGSGSGLLDLDGAIAAGMLTTNPAGSASPHFPLPGNGSDQAALAYLHANCGNCHNPTSDLITSGQAIFNARLETAKLATVTATPAYTTMVGVNTFAITPQGSDCSLDPAPCAQILACPGTPVGSAAQFSCLVAPEDTVNSDVFFRFTTAPSSGKHMPQPPGLLHTTDGSGQAILQAWINQL